MAYAATLGALTGELIEAATGLPSKVGKRGIHGYILVDFEAHGTGGADHLNRVLPDKI